MTSTTFARGAAAALALVLAATGAAAQAQEGDAVPRRTRVALGPQLVPRFPGSDEVVVRPLVDVARTRGDDPFAFEAPDESFGASLLSGGGFTVGPAIGFQGRRSRRETDGLLRKVGATFEVGGFVEYQVTPSFRLRTEVRQGVGGHKGLIGVVGADYVVRDADKWLFSLGPRVTLANDRYHRAYFGVDQAAGTAPAAVAAGLRPYDAEGGLQAVGATAGLIHQFGPRWGVYGYARYDRLVADPGRSPVVRAFGSRNQLSGGVALTYTFGR